ncbi:hypothetical protein BG004_002845, partial [Podila humilis]
MEDAMSRSKAFVVEWIKTKSQRSVQQFAETLPAPTKQDECHPWCTLISDALWASLEQRAIMEPKDSALLVSQLAKVNGEESNALVAKLLIDLIWVIEISNEFAGEYQTRRLKELTKAVISEDFIPVNLMKERWEISFLESVGLIGNAKAFMKRVV